MCFPASVIGVSGESLAKIADLYEEHLKLFYP